MNKLIITPGLLFIPVFALAIVLTTSTLVVANETFIGKPMIIAAQSHYGKGVITKIDKTGKRVELKHGPIKSIGWMSMQMFFDIDDADMLDEIKPGDTVDFEFIKTRDNRFVITDIENDA